MELNVTTEQSPVAVTVVHLKGDLDASTEPEVVAKARELVEQGATRLVIDLDGVRYISSAGVRALHALYLLLRPSGDDQDAVLQGVRDGSYTSPHLKLVKPNKDVTSVLTTTGIDMYLGIYPDLASALAAF